MHIFKVMIKTFLDLGIENSTFVARKGYMNKNKPFFHLTCTWEEHAILEALECNFAITIF